jgi:hypothetical protein
MRSRQSSPARHPWFFSNNNNQPTVSGWAGIRPLFDRHDPRPFGPAEKEGAEPEPDAREEQLDVWGLTSRAQPYPLAGRGAIPQLQCAACSGARRTGSSQCRSGRNRQNHTAENDAIDRPGVRAMVNPRRGECDAQSALVDEKARRFVGEELRHKRVVDQRGQARRPTVCHDGVLAW